MITPTVKVIEPGSVVSTNFGKRSAEEVTHTASVPDYASFVSATLAIFDRLRSSTVATKEDVASVIFEAAIDGTDQCRNVATEDIKPLVAARRETSEAKYIKFMREQFNALGS